MNKYFSTSGITCLLLAILILVPSSKAGYALKHTDSNSYDVIVVGAEPEGIAAAVSAARSGAKTLLIDERKNLGGLMIYGMLNYLDIGLDEFKRPVNTGIFKEWYDLVGNKIAFDIDDAKHAFHKLIFNEQKLQVMLGTKIHTADLNSAKEIHRIKTIKNGNSKIFTAKRFIDATADADFAFKLGADYFIGQEDINNESATMGVTLIMHFSGVDWGEIKQAALNQSFGDAGIKNNAAWGFWDVADKYPRKNKNTRLRGLNIAKTEDGIYINALQIFGVDGLNELSKQHAIEIGKDETRHFLKWAKLHFPGFENATIKSFPSELYVRETRHIHTLYQLPISDVWENRTHWDTVAVGGYPVDIQASHPNGKDRIVINPKQYEIPFRSLIPIGIKNLLIASRSAGFSSLAAGSARVIPTGMSLGEAAGAAAQLSIVTGENFHQLSKDKQSINLLQKRLEKSGARIYGLKSSYPYQDEKIYPYLKYLYSSGLIFASYQNDFHLEEYITKDMFYNILKEGIRRIHNLKITFGNNGNSGNMFVTNEDLMKTLNSLQNHHGFEWKHKIKLDNPSGSYITKKDAFKALSKILQSKKD